MAAKTRTDRAKPRVSTSTLALLESAGLGLRRCENDPSPASRLAASRLAALRTAAAVVASKSDPRITSSNEGPQNVWEILPGVAPALSEWAAYFAVTPRPRHGRGRGWWHRVSIRREADEFQLNTEKFFALVVDMLELTETFGGAIPRPDSTPTLAGPS